jgi:predicted phage tail protein
MKTFHFSGDMADRFGSEISLNVKTFREAVNAFDVTFKGFRKFLIRKYLSGITYNIISNAGTSYEGSSLEISLKHDSYYLVAKPIGAGGALLGMVGQGLMGYGMSWLEDKLNPIEETGKEYEKIETNSYLYESNENIVEQGRPVPLVYGMLRVGSLVINSCVNNYDYDYDNATIYNYPVAQPAAQGGFQINPQRIAGGTAQYAFISNNNLVNLRNQPGNDASDNLLPYDMNDPTKRTLSNSIGGAGEAKRFTDDLANSSYNHDYGSSASEGGSRQTLGPSVNTASTADGGATTVGGGQGSRPFLYPNINHKDGDMRPNAASTPCGVRIRDNNGTIETLNISYVGAGINSVMTVGGRGNFQKLESIGIYKSLDILCEGPIAGLGNPIGGFDSDVGQTNYPTNQNLQLVLAPGAGNGISVGNLRFSAGDNHLESIENDSEVIDIINNGGGAYTNVPDGTYNVLANGIVDPASNISVRVDNPTSSLSASIEDFSFSEYVGTLNNANILADPATVWGFGVSSNANLFLVNRLDGSIVLNTNTQGPNAIDAQYVNNGVANLAALEQDNQTLNTSFAAGQGYGSAPFLTNISPPNGIGDFSFSFQDTNPYTRRSEATLADASLVRDFNTFVESRLNNFFNTNAQTVPIANLTWDTLCRMQIDDPTPGALDTAAERNTFVYVPIGSQRMDTDSSWRTNYSSRTVYLRVTVAEMIGMVRMDNIRSTRAFFVRSGAQPNNNNVTAYEGNYESWSWGNTSPPGLQNYSSNTNNTWAALGETAFSTAFAANGSFELGALFAYTNGVFSGAAINALATYAPFLNNNWMNVGGVSSFKFVPGSGSPTGPTTGIKMPGGGDFFNLHSIETGFNNLDSVAVTNPGNISYGNADGVQTIAPFGFYHPKLHPRVYVFVIRRYQNLQGDETWQVCRTNIDAVVSINGMGLVQNAILLNVPDLCVYDEANVEIGAGGNFTPLKPQHIDRVSPIHVRGPSIASAVGGANATTRYRYQDVGFILSVDPSSSAQTIKFDIQGNGQVSNNFTTDAALREQMHSLYADFGEHVQNNLPFPSSSVATGMVPDLWGAPGQWYNNNQPFKSLTIQPSNAPNAPPPTTLATINVPIETIEIANTRMQAIVQSGHGATTLPGGTHICTGRPLPNITLTNAGNGYAGGLGAQVTLDLYNHGKMVTSCNVIGNRNTVNIGYRPLTRFYALGTSFSKVTAGLAGNPANGLFARAQADLERALTCSSLIIEFTTDSLGSIDSAVVIDGGHCFNSLANDSDIYLWVPTEFIGDADNASFLQQFPQNGVGAGVTPAEVVSSLLPGLGALQAPTATARFNFCATATNIDTNNPFVNAANDQQLLFGGIGPGQSFPKSDLVLSINGLGVNGEINSFSIFDSGSGFAPDKLINNPFVLAQSSLPTLNLTFAGGSLTAAAIDRTAPVQGYSNADTNIRVYFSPPPIAPGAVIEPPNDPENDANAVYRSIYLNDVPIRDTNNRYNFSRFHFDMRIGNFRNGRNGNALDLVTSIPENDIDITAQGRLLDDEFLVPGTTNFINYPLIGPRNHGNKDYYYSHTIKNSEVTDICISIKINQLHYIYEGDEEILYINLVPILGAVIGFYIGQWLVTLVIKVAFPDPVVVCGCICSGGSTTGNPSSLGEMAMAAAIKLLVLAGGIVGAVLGFMTTKTFKCSKAPFLCFKIGSVIKNSGEIWPAKIKFAIEYGLEGQQLNQEIIEIAGCATNSYVKDIFINNLPQSNENGNADQKLNRIFKIYRITREMDPVTGGLYEARYKIDAELLSITEYVCGFFAYPNTALIGTRINSKDMPNIPKREFLVKGKLIRVPSNYLPEGQNQAARYPGAWNGEFNDQLTWSSNPAWIIYDLLTNQRYGVGKYGITDDDIDRWSFYEFAEYCDQEVDVFIDGVATTERRHMSNLYIDSTRNAYEYIQDLLKLYNANLNFTAGKFYFIADMEDLEPVMLFNNANVHEDGFSYASTPKSQRITACTVDYVDERDNYIPKSEYVEDSQSISKHGYSHIRVPGFGVTRKGEANRIAWQKILTKQFEKELVEFKAGIQASYLRVGDVIDVLDNNKYSLHSGGKIARIIDQNTVELDIPTNILNDVAEIKIQRAEASDEFNDAVNSAQIENRRSEQWLQYTITARNGFNVTLAQNLDPTTLAGAIWIIVDNEQSEIRPKQYRIKSIKEISPLEYNIVAIDYVAEKFERINNAADAPDVTAEEIQEYYGPDIIEDNDAIIDANPDVRN